MYVKIMKYISFKCVDILLSIVFIFIKNLRLFKILVYLELYFL